MAIDQGLFGFVKRSKYRKVVLKSLLDGPKVQAEIMKVTGMYRSHVTRTLHQLERKGLVQCINPDNISGKIYELNTQNVFGQGQLMQLLI